MKNIIYKLQNLFLALLLTISVFPLNFIEIKADGLDVNTAINQIIGGYIGNYSNHYSYDGGQYFDTILMSDSADELHNIGLDCTSGTLAIVSKAIRNAGGDPYNYFGNCRGKLNSVYPYDLSESFTNMILVATGPVDSSILLPGDILVYGSKGGKGHMNVYTGNNQTFDFGSNGKGDTGNFQGFSNYVTYKTASTSTTGSYSLSRVFRITMNQTVTYHVSKTSSNQSFTSNNRLYSLAGAVFGVYTSSDCNEESRIDTLTTDASGNASSTKSLKSDIKQLYMKELSAPSHYDLSDTSIHSATITNGNATFTFNDSPRYANANISLNKIDAEGKVNAADMKDAEFTFDYFDTYDINNQTPYASWSIKTIESNTNGVISYTTNMDDAHLVSGSYIRNNDGTPIIPLGTLRIRETKASYGYTVNGAYLENGSVKSDGDALLIQIVEENNQIVMKTDNLLTSGSYTKKENPIRSYFEIQKKDKDVLIDESQQAYNGVRSQGDATFANAEFDLYYLGNGTETQVSMMIDHDGDGLGDGSEYMPSSSTPIDHVILDSSGYYQTPNQTYLGFGNYKLVETKAPLGYSLKNSDGNPITINFSIIDDRQIVTLDAIEKVYQGDIQITKTVNTKNTSSFTRPEEGAVFDVVLKKYVLDYANGREVTREIVLEAYDHMNDWYGSDNSNHSVISYTNMEYDQITTDINGVAKSKKLAYGEYYIAQVSGNSERKIIEDIEEFSISEENQPTLLFTATNDTKSYVLKLFKKDADTGKRVSLTSSAFKVHMLEDEDGKDVSSSTTKETSLQTRLINGYVTQTIGEDSNKTRFDVFMTTSNNPSDEIEDGVFYGVNNTQKTSEISTTALPLQLLPGTYQLEEVITSDGYVTHEPIKFTINSDSITRVNATKQNIIEIEFENNQLTTNLSFKKEILDWKEADISLLDKDLRQFGFTLYANEDIYSPDDGSLVIRKDEIARKLTHNPTQPYEEYGEVFADEEGNINFTDLPLGNYYLKETTYPSGYVPNKQPIEILLSQNLFDHYVDTRTSLLFGLGSITDGSVSIDNVDVIINDEKTTTFTIQNDVTKTSISKQSITNSEELEGASMRLVGEDVDLEWTSTNKPYKIEGLKEGTYTLIEEASPNGYFYHDDITFTVEEDGTIQQVEMKDTPIHYEIKKVDDEGKLVEGVTLKLFDITDIENKQEIELPNDGITTSSAIILDQILQAEHTYELVEEEIIEGVYKADSIQFEVPKISNESSITITMVDLKTSISVLKVDQYGDAVKDAILTIYKAQKNEDDSYTILEDEIVGTIQTSNEPVDISSYVKGSSTDEEYYYAIKETTTPFGYETMEDTYFKVTGNKDSHQLIQLLDEKKNFNLKVVKVSAKDPLKTLEDAEFTLLREDGSIVEDTEGNACVGVTDASGSITFNVPYNKDIIVFETKAPKGFEIEEKGYSIQYEDDYDFSHEKPIVVTFKDEPINNPNTSDSSNVFLIMLMLFSSVSLAYFSIRGRMRR